MNKSAKRAIFFIIFIAIAVLVFTFLTTEDKETSTKSSQKQESVATGKRPNSISNNPRQKQANNDSVHRSNNKKSNFVTGIEDLPRSLQGTQVDGDIIIDSHGDLVPTRGLRRLFDYFLSALGEESHETINARLEAYVTHRTPEPAASEAVALYHRYIAYLQELTAIENQYGTLQMRATQQGELDLNMVRQRQQDIDKVRRQIFDAEVITAFFAIDNQLQDYNLAMIEIQRDNTLTAAQKEQARLDYLNRLPDSLIKEGEVNKQTMQTLMVRTEQMRKANATDSELFAMRAEIVGIPAAERLAETDAVNRDFNSRFGEYQQAKLQILSSNDRADIKQQKLEEVTQQLFNETEQKRLTGYEVLIETESN